MKCEICQKECKNIKGLIAHISRSHDLTSKDYYLKFLGSQKYCLICGNLTDFNGLIKGFSNACSIQCGAKIGGQRAAKKINNLNEEEKIARAKNIAEKYNEKTLEEKDLILQTRKQTNREKFGTDYATQNSQISGKISEIKLNYSEEEKLQIQNKRKETTLEKYGVDHIFKLDEIVEKSKQTKLERYDDENFNNHEQTKQTKLEKYGNENFNNNNYCYIIFTFNWYCCIFFN